MLTGSLFHPTLADEVQYQKDFSQFVIPRFSELHDKIKIPVVILAVIWTLVLLLIYL